MPDTVERQRKARKVLKELFKPSETTLVIHYSCESFYNRPDGSTPRITSIAVRNLSSGQTHSFSIHKVAELRKIRPSEIKDNYDLLEKEMLQELFQFLEEHRMFRFLHWNMRDINYGFAAIEHRYRVLGGIPYQLPDSNKYDLSRMLIDIYGVHYIDHPRLTKLLEKNHIKALDFLTGAAEADAWEKADYVALHRSTLRKVDVLANIAERAFDGSLLTNTSWWDMHGGYIRSIALFLKENIYIAAVVVILALVGFIWDLVS